jgi:hypothetical protein
MAKKILDIEALQQENEALRVKLAEQESLRDTNAGHYSRNLQNEINKIKTKGTPRGQGSSDPIVVREQHDHKNISLWTKDGKRIGPMHPDNAVRLLNDLASFGCYVSSDQPTPAQIQAYMQTDEYKKAQEAEGKRRARKDRSRKAGQIEKLAEKIAAMSGQTVDAINNILKARDAKPLSEARA